MPATDVRRQAQPGPGTVMQVFGFGGGMAFYALHLLVGSPLVLLACRLGSTWPIHLATVGAVLGVVASALAAGWVLRAGLDGLGDEPLARRREFLGATGLFLNGLALLVVLFSDTPSHFLDPCLPV